jgi:16S rRNA (guanine966-N2)-methyltransferase
MIRIIAGRWKGRRLAVPPGLATRPTSDRARQALFDMLWHAPWAGRAAVEGARVLDAFAGSGALGIEALSRGATEAVFIEHDAAALRVLRENLGALGGGPHPALSRRERVLRPTGGKPSPSGRGLGEGLAARVIAGDATAPPAPPFAATLAFLDPPYGQGLAARALVALAARGWCADGALVCIETGREETLDPAGFTPLADRTHGKARLRVLRFSAGSGASR